MQTILKRFFFVPAPILIFISLLLLILFGLFSKHFYEAKDQAFQKNLLMAANSQQEICLSYISVISSIDGKVIGVDRRGRTYNIRANGFKPEINKSYAFSGKLNTDGIMILTAMTEYPFRNLKYLFSSLSLILVSYLVIRFIRFNRTELSFYIKTTNGEKE